MRTPKSCSSGDVLNAGKFTGREGSSRMQRISLARTYIRNDAIVLYSLMIECGVFID